MNLTLGKSLTKSATVQISKAEEPVCLSMLGGVAKMCAKLNGVAPSSNGGLITCLTMQPKIFGESPLNFDFPCFDMNTQEIRIIETPKKPDEEKKEEDEEEAPTTADSEETIGGFKVEDILKVVSTTADQGIKIISELFGISDDEKPEPAVAPAAESKTAPEAPATKKP